MLVWFFIDLFVRRQTVISYLLSLTLARIDSIASKKTKKFVDRIFQISIFLHYFEYSWVELDQKDAIKMKLIIIEWAQTEF